MTSHNRAGYYGLKIPESVETEITSLSDKPLLELIHDLTSCIRYRTDFVTYVIHFNSASEIETLSTENKIALLRWLCERLAWFHLPQTIRAKEAFS